MVEYGDRSVPMMTKRPADPMPYIFAAGAPCAGWRNIYNAAISRERMGVLTFGFIAINNNKIKIYSNETPAAQCSKGNEVNRPALLYSIVTIVVLLWHAAAVRLICQQAAATHLQ